MSFENEVRIAWEVSFFLTKKEIDKSKTREMIKRGKKERENESEERIK